MREIKFRYKWKRKGDGHIETRVFSIEFLERHCQDTLALTDSNKYELIARNEYTGSKDKNGTEVYEGGIVRFQGAPAVIRWKDGGFFVGDWTPGAIGECHNRCEVIGDIYDDPELLEGA